MTRGPEPQLTPLKHDETLGDPDLVRGQQLLRHTQPLARSDLRRRRVWNALDAGQRSRLGFKLTALHVALASVLFAAVSSAAVGGYYVKHRAPAAVEIKPALRPLEPISRAVSKGLPRGPGAERTPPVSEERVAPGADENAPGRATAARSRSESAPRKAADSDAELLIEAMRARSDGDARRVAELVDQYRARRPRGALQEEALILSIESAALRQAPNTSALAREYLRRFPRGRFAAQAQRALATPAR